MRKILAFLFLLLIVVIDAGKIKTIVKKVAKRMRIKGVPLATSARLDYAVNTDAMMDASRNISAQLVANHLMIQSSVQNLQYENSVKILLGLMNTEKFVGGICGGDDMNYFQMTRYWKKQREGHKRNEQEEVTWRPLSSFGAEYNTFMVSFKRHSIWDYSSTPIYTVRMEITSKPDSISNYTITSINEVGACTEHGTVDFDQTDVYMSLYESDPERKKTRNDVIRHVTELFDTNKIEKKIPMKWLSLFPPNDVKFEGSICTGDTLIDRSRVGIFNWWKRFQIMYRPANSEMHTYVQLIGAEKDRFVFRATLNVKLGTNDDRPVENWDFKFQVHHNMAGDGKWYIDKFEVMCSPIPREELMKNHAKAYQEVIGNRISSMIQSGQMWYTATGYLYELTSTKGLEIENCAKFDGSEMEKTTSLESLQHKFWKQNKETNGKMEGFELDRPISEIGEKMSVEIGIIWTPQPTSQLHESVWKFFLKWDDDLQSFVIYKIIFGCPERDDRNKDYSVLMKSGVRLVPFPRA